MLAIASQCPETKVWLARLGVRRLSFADLVADRQRLQPSGCQLFFVVEIARHPRQVNGDQLQMSMWYANAGPVGSWQSSMLVWLVLRSLQLIIMLPAGTVCHASA